MQGTDFPDSSPTKASAQSKTLSVKDSLTRMETIKTLTLSTLSTTFRCASSQLMKLNLLNSSLENHQNESPTSLLIFLTKLISSATHDPDRLCFNKKGSLKNYNDVLVFQSKFVVLYDANFVVQFVITFNEHHDLCKLSWIKMSIFFYFKSSKTFLAMVFYKVNEFRFPDG